MRSYRIVVIFFLAFWGCSQGQSSRSASKSTSVPKTKRVNPTSTQKAQDDHAEKEHDISSSDGVVVASVGDHISKPLSLYNEDGTLWLTVAFDGGNKGQLSKIHPFALSIDEFLLVFKCLGRSKEYYTVIINENTGEQKYIKSADPGFCFERWEDHILGCFSVGFNPSNNPVKIAPTYDSKSLTFYKDEFYTPVKIQKDWLQVKWGDEENWKYGWIKWRKAGALLLYLFYTA